MIAEIHQEVADLLYGPRPSGWRITRWLPLILTTVKPARSSALTTFTPGMAGREPGTRRRQGSASAHPEGRPRRATLPARPAGRQPQLPPSHHHPPPRRRGAAARKRTRRRPRPVRRHKAHGLRGSQRRFSHTKSAARIGTRAVLGQPRIIADARPRAGPLQAACPAGPARQNMRPPLSTQRRRATAESGHSRLFPVTRGLTPSHRV